MRHDFYLHLALVSGLSCSFPTRCTSFQSRTEIGAIFPALYTPGQHRTRLAEPHPSPRTNGIELAPTVRGLRRAEQQEARADICSSPEPLSFFRVRHHATHQPFYYTLSRCNLLAPLQYSSSYSSRGSRIAGMVVHPSLSEHQRWPPMAAPSASLRERSLADSRPQLKKQDGRLSQLPPSAPPAKEAVAPSSSSSSPSSSSMWDQPLEPKQQQQQQQLLPPPSPEASAAPPDPWAMSASDQWCARNSAALLEACCNHDLAKAEKILKQSQSSLEQVEQEGETATATAAAVAAGSPGRMQQLVLATDDFRDSALHLASGNGEVDIVRLLLARGADVNAENNLGSTPLNRAAVAGRDEVSVGRGCGRRVGLDWQKYIPTCQYVQQQYVYFFHVRMLIS